MILVRNQIRDMLGGETGKIYIFKIKYKFRVSSNENSSFLYNGLVQLEDACRWGFIVKFMIVFVTRRDSSSFWLRVVTVSLI